MSDGVHDNIDPEHLGLTPAEAGGATGEKDWEKVGWESGEQTRLLFRLKALQTILFRPSERHNLSKEDQRPENSWSHTQKVFLSFLLLLIISYYRCWLMLVLIWLLKYETCSNCLGFLKFFFLFTLVISGT